MERKLQFYSLAEILKRKADYNVIFGERSNGKTYAALEYGLRNYVRTGKQMAYVRRWKEDLRGKRADTLFSAHVQSGLVEKLTKGKYNEVFYMSGKWYLSHYNPDTKKRFPDDKPLCYGFCLSETEHDKSTSYPEVTTVIFDEFLTRRYYLQDEFVLFMNTLSTIIRQRADVKVFMLGNTVNQYCPYFSEMGLKHIKEQPQGTIDVYKFGEEGATVAVEYAASISSQKQSNKYFCFDNSRLQMITGGKWELAVYPHLPHKYVPKDVLLSYFIVFQGETLQANIIQVGNDLFTYVHRKTTPIKDKDALIYRLEASSLPNTHRRLLSTATPLLRKIAMFYATDKVFYQNNEIGEMVRNYIITSQKNNITGN